MGPEDPDEEARGREPPGLLAALAHPVAAVRGIRPEQLWRLAPGIGELRDYDRSGLRVDLTAALSVTAVAVPASLGMASLAGVPPTVGIYATLLPLALYALFGSSRQVIVGPEGALSALTAATLAPLAAAQSARYVELAAVLALLIGAVLLVSSLLGLGFMADFLSKPVLLGYINGTALLIISSQLGKLFGLSITAQGFPERIREFAHELPDADWRTAVLSAGLLALAILLRIYLPRFPGALGIVVLGGILSVSFDLKSHGIATVGHVTAGLPRISAPQMSFADVRSLALPAVGLALVGFGDAIANGRNFARKRGYEIDANQELAGLAAAQFAAGFSGAMSVGSSGSRTALSDEAGGRSRVVALTVAALVAVVAAFAMPLIEVLPQAVLGVVVIAAALGLIEVHAIWKLRRVRDAEVGLALAALVGVVLFGVLNGLIVAVGLSIGVFVYRAVRPHDAVLGSVEDVDGYHDVSRSPTAQTIPGLVVYRFDAPIFFPNALYFREQVLELVERTVPKPQWLMLNAEAVTYVDATAVDMLLELRQALADEGVLLTIARAKGMLRDVFDSTGVTAAVGRENFFPTVRAGVAAFTADTPEHRGPSSA
ncbi:MAG: SulP family inorganic anion transporter [Gaiellaceae bacterium]